MDRKRANPRRGVEIEGGLSVNASIADFKVPNEFWTQYPTYANPPTLTMTVTSFIRRLRQHSPLLHSQLGLDMPLFTEPSTALPSLHLNNPGLAHSYLSTIYPHLRRHYLWFRSTQRGLLKPYGRSPTSRTEAYRWRGRTETHVLTSGLDDYPSSRFATQWRAAPRSHELDGVLCEDDGRDRRLPR